MNLKTSNRSLSESMNKKHKKKILQKLLAAVNAVGVDLEKHNGDAAKAAANQIGTRINILHPYSHLFDESFKRKVLSYMNTGRAAEEGDVASMTKLEAMTEPTGTLIQETLEKMIRKLS